MSVNRRFLSQLPISFPILGREVRLGLTAQKAITIELGPCTSPDQLKTVYNEWDLRKWMIVSGTEQDAHIERIRCRLLESDKLKDFVKFYLSQPIGPRLLTFDQGMPFESYRGRVQAIDEAALMWDVNTHWDRTPKGKLRSSVACGGYRTKVEYDPSTVKAEEIYGRTVNFFLCGSSVLAVR